VGQSKSLKSRGTLFIINNEKIFFILIATTLILSSCAFHPVKNSNSTEIDFSKKIFKVVETIQGSSRAGYILGFGSLVKQSMIAKPRAKMF
jgi:hypothetical protein